MGAAVIGARLPHPLEGSGIECLAGIAMNRRNRDRTGLAEVSPTRRARNFALSPRACMTQLGRVPVLLRETSVCARIGGGGATLPSRSVGTDSPSVVEVLTPTSPWADALELSAGDESSHNRRAQT